MISTVIARAARSRTRLTSSPAWELLTDSAFRALWLSNSLSFTAFDVRTMAQSWLVLEMTGSDLLVGVAAGVRAGPVILLALVGGALVDRIGGKAVLTLVRASLGVIAALTALLVLTDAINVWIVIVLSALSGAVTAFGMPANPSLLPYVVRRSLLLPANSLSQMGGSIGRIAGPSASGFLIAAFGIGSSFLALTGAYVIATWLTARIRLKRPVAKRSGDRRMAREIREGFDFARRTPVVAWLLVLSFTALFATTIMPVIPTYARDVLKVGETGFGLLLGAQAVGSLLGAAFIASRTDIKRKGLLILVGSLVWAAGMVVFGYSRSYALSLAVMFAMGASVSGIISGVITLMQMHVPDEMRGRVMSIHSMSLQAVTLGWLVGGALSQAIGPERMLTLTASIFTGMTIAAFASSRALREA